MMTAIQEILRTGGPVVAVLGVLSIAALTVGLVKIWQFLALSLGREGRAERALVLFRMGDQAGALQLLERDRNPVAQTLYRSINGHRRHLPADVIREEAKRFGQAALSDLRSWFRVLEVIGTLSPLLGLFGTVLGMIEAFRQLEQAGSQVNPAILSGGIWEALLTTAIGLAVAMPTVAMLNWLERRVERTATAMDRIVTAVFTVDLAQPAMPDDNAERAAILPLGPGALSNVRG